MLRKALGLSRVYVSLHVAGAGVSRLRIKKAHGVPPKSQTYYYLKCYTIVEYAQYY